MIITIIFDSGYGHTTKQAEAIATGAKKIERAEVHLIQVSEGIPWELLEKSNAIIFGSPTYTGTVTSRFKKFFEDSTSPVWNTFKWRNKIAAGFTNSGALSGDKYNTLSTIANFAAQNGMIWVGLDLHPAGTFDEPNNDLNRLGSWLGAMATSEMSGPGVEENDLLTAEYLGKRVAEITARFI